LGKKVDARVNRDWEAVLRKSGSTEMFPRRSISPRTEKSTHSGRKLSWGGKRGLLP